MNTEKEITELKSRVDRIEKWIHKVIASNNAPEADESTYDIVSLDVKDVTQENMLPTYAYKLQVRNNADRKMLFTGKIVFYDGDGFELEYSLVSPFTVPAGKLLTVSGQATLLSRDNVQQIADIKALVEVRG